MKKNKSKKLHNEIKANLSSMQFQNKKKTSKILVQSPAKA